MADVAKALSAPLRGQSRGVVVAGVAGASVALLVLRYLLRALRQRREGARRADDVVGMGSPRGVFWESGKVFGTGAEDDAVAKLCDKAYAGLEHACETWEAALHVATRSHDTPRRARIRRVLRRLYATIDACDERVPQDNDSFVSAQSDMFGDGALDGLQSLDSTDAVSDAEHADGASPARPHTPNGVPAGPLSPAPRAEIVKDADGHAPFYAHALALARSGEVKCRRIRTKMVGCASDEEFLAKVHCLRDALNIALEEPAARQWFVDAARDLITSVFRRANKDPSAFITSYDRMMEFVLEAADKGKVDGPHGRHHNRHHHQSRGSTASQADSRMKAELLERGVVCVSLYDVAFDFLILDAFDDLESPPSALVSVMQNSWIPQSMKEKALSTAVWSIVAAKSQGLSDKDGFLARFYALSTHTSPLFAYGFLGPAGELRTTCEFFKDQMVGFVRDMFASEGGRYDSAETLAAGVMAIARRRMGEALERLR